MQNCRQCAERKLTHRNNDNDRMNSNKVNNRQLDTKPKRFVPIGVHACARRNSIHNQLPDQVANKTGVPAESLAPSRTPCQIAAIMTKQGRPAQVWCHAKLPFEYDRSNDSKIIDLFCIVLSSDDSRWSNTVINTACYVRV